MNVQHVQNLGILKDRLLIFGGPYGNLQATGALFEVAESFSIPASNIICTGDITAYCGDPLATSMLMQQSGIPVIQGNCEENLAANADDCGCGFDEETACDILSAKWYNHCKSEVSDNLKLWMGALPIRFEFVFGGRKFHVLHGSDDSINEFIFPSASDDHVLSQINKTGADIVIGGHSGLPFSKIIDNKIWHNTGSIGMPANDGTPRGWYSIIEREGDDIVFYHKSLTYDHDSAANVMRDHDLNEYAKTLETGIWPSFDTLPNAEKQNAGIALKEQSFRIPVKFE